MQKDLDMIDMTAVVLYRALTLQVTMAPTSGKSCASVSLTTEITGSYKWNSLLDYYREAWVFKSCKWIKLLFKSKNVHESDCDTWTDLLSLVLSQHVSRQRSEDVAVPQIRAGAGDTVLRAAEPFTCVSNSRRTKPHQTDCKNTNHVQ